MCSVFCFRILLFLLPSLTSSEVLTQGPWIINSTTNQRLHLKCANWYGAHQELFVVGGLELRSISRLTDSLLDSGANCVRLPYSIEMVKKNPIVKREAIAGILPSDNCNSTDRAVDIFDCVVFHLQKRGIFIILNNHNSWSSWVGAGAEVQQGLWNFPDYSTEDWIRSLEFLVRRYKVIGVDFRNEIHDQDGVRITWGESNDINTDWLAATTEAYDRLHRIDPDILAIVGGLCWNLDLRAMSKNVGPIKAFNNRKLVYTVHLYSFSFWWRVGDHVIHNIVTPVSFWLFIVCVVASLGCFYLYFEGKVVKNRVCESKISQYERLYASDDDQGTTSQWGTTTFAFLSMSILFHAGWLTLSIVFSNVTADAGCSSLSQDSYWMIGLTSVLVMVTGLYLFCFCCEFSLLLLIGFGFFWLSVFFLSVFFVGIYLSSESAMNDFLSVWALNNRPVPVWLGEFGTGDPDEPVFRYLWNYVHKIYNLDFAYWAFNGRVWKNNQWESESFGMMNEDYSKWRNPGFLKTLFFDD